MLQKNDFEFGEERVKVKTILSTVLIFSRCTPDYGAPKRT